VPVPIDPGLPSGSELASVEAAPAAAESTPDVDTEPVDQDLGESYADA
jgi:hypothetical protein